jgi:hypothetical protein
MWNEGTNDILLSKGIKEVLNFDVLNKTSSTSKTFKNLKTIINDFISKTESVCLRDETSYCDPTHSIMLYSRHIEKLIDCTSNSNSYGIFLNDIHHLL